MDPTVDRKRSFKILLKCLIHQQKLVDETVEERRQKLVDQTPAVAEALKTILRMH